MYTSGAAKRTAPAVSLDDEASVVVHTDSHFTRAHPEQAVEVLPVSEQTLSILLHPEDLKFVQNTYSQEVCSKRGWDLQPEAVLARGDCQIHTKVSSVDYTFSSRIEQVLKHFFKENHQQFPSKNDDSKLLNDHPIANDQIATATESSSTVSENQDVINE